jgi:formylglycine-generating enzyme required for sulfatase activity
MGGLLGAIGMDGPWDIKRVLGTVPVEADGSALFRVPANTPIAVHPLDDEGKSLQVMRSWFTAMPGEVLSCAGCHEPQNSGPPNRRSIAARRPPSEITPWHGPARGFSFAREVQPVLDRYCVGCHDGGKEEGGRRKEEVAVGGPNPRFPIPVPPSSFLLPPFPSSLTPHPSSLDLRGDQKITDWSSQIAGNVGPAVGGKFSVAYAELHRFVRRPGIESDIHLLAPMEFHADSTELVQLLRKGHYGVRLDAEAWDRLVTWIDLGAPYHGTWTEIVGKAQVEPQAARRRAMLARYAGVDVDPEEIPAVPPSKIEPDGGKREAGGRGGEEEKGSRGGGVGIVKQSPLLPFSSSPLLPFSPSTQAIDLGEGSHLDLVRIPAGDFVMGDQRGQPDEQPATVVKVARPFWIGRCEVTNAEFARFDPAHDSHVESMHGYQFGIHGYPANGPRQPVVRVSWNRAMDFCRWLSAKTGRRFNLPTEAQWEYACRAGTATPFYYGDLDTDFSKFANLGDATLREFAVDTYIQVHLIPNPNKYDDWVPKDDRFNDGAFLSVDVGQYQPNAWGLCDMHGNAAEWTRSLYRPYPYDDGDGRNDPVAPGRRVVRGGSWYDRPKRCTSSFRLAYAPYQNVFNVGFRVVMEEQ